jgi:hypothetical protein
MNLELDVPSSLPMTLEIIALPLLLSIISSLEIGHTLVTSLPLTLSVPAPLSFTLSAN